MNLIHISNVKIKYEQTPASEINNTKLRLTAWKIQLWPPATPKQTRFGYLTDFFRLGIFSEADQGLPAVPYPDDFIKKQIYHEKSIPIFFLVLLSPLYYGEINKMTQGCII